MPDTLGFASLAEEVEHDDIHWTLRPTLRSAPGRLPAISHLPYERGGHQRCGLQNTPCTPRKSWPSASTWGRAWPLPPVKSRKNLPSPQAPKVTLGLPSAPCEMPIEKAALPFTPKPFGSSGSNSGDTPQRKPVGGGEILVTVLGTLDAMKALNLEST